MTWTTAFKLFAALLRIALAVADGILEMLRAREEPYP